LYISCWGAGVYCGAHASLGGGLTFGAKNSGDLLGGSIGGAFAIDPGFPGVTVIILFGWGTGFVGGSIDFGVGGGGGVLYCNAICS
jgi:hypothetical protein